MSEKEKRYRRNDNCGENHGDWQNPTFTGRNKLPGRFQARPYSALNEAVLAEPSFRYRSLDGEWKFAWFPSPSLCPQDFHENDFDSSTWDNLPVPSNWEIHGYGTPQYLNIRYPYSHDIANPPAINPNDNPTGCYIKEFEIPELWLAGQENIILRFEGIRSAAIVWVNGTEVGYTQDSYSPAEFNIGSNLQAGRNILAVKVLKWCAGTYLEDQDMWRLGGIFRSVSLRAERKGGIADVYARCQFDSIFQDADFRVTITLSEIADENLVERTARWFLYENGSEDIFASGKPETVKIGSSANPVIESTVRVRRPKQWSDEFPFLYRLVVEVSNGNERTVDVRVIPFGFRQIDIVGGYSGAVLNVNGRPIKLLGVNRHDFHPRYGQAVPRELIRADLVLMKQNNINAIRCSHYPNPDALYELADELGLYVIDEANIESHGLRHKLPASLPEWTANCVERMERMVLCHRNHPCIIMWSLGNEAGYGTNFKEMKRAALLLDQTRPIHYEGDHKLDSSDVFSTMYSDVRTVRRIGLRKSVRVGLGEQGRLRGWRVVPRQYKNKPFLLCEYAHSMGNSLGNFSDYMRLIWNFPHIAGGFIWDFADLALYKKNDKGKEFLAYGGDFGEEPHDGIFCADGILTADRKLKPQMAEVKNLYAPVAIRTVDLTTGTVAILNRHSSRSLADYKIRWYLERNGERVADGVVQKLNIPPGEALKINLFRNLSAYPGSGEGFLTLVFHLRVDCPWAPIGHELVRLQLPVPEVEMDESLPDIMFPHLDKGQIEKSADARDLMDAKKADLVGLSDENWLWKEDSGFLLIARSTAGVRINLSKCTLENIDFGKGGIFQSPLEPDFFRAPTDNEKLGFAAFLDDLLPPFPGAVALKGWLYRIAARIYGSDWENAARYRILKNYRVMNTRRGLQVVLSIKIKGFLGRVRQQFLFTTDGKITVRLSGRPIKPLVRFGTRFALSPRYQKLLWYGRGPHESYLDRKSSALMGRFEMDGPQMTHEYLKPQESGNRTDVRWVSFSDGGLTVTFTSTPGKPFGFSARYASRESVARAKHAHEIEESENLHVHIDGAQRGVGGSYPGVLALLPQYKLKSFRRYSLEYSISPELT